ncbi:transmembrane protein [Anaeramoeba flamelloides]|uniref:Transmembrane protein n=1 Tax=Anaeramoeba flamelloides TaxID=1746091 RepID=A0ABQ8XJE7_9EUKA|nr:transmembrane protein [Anaeramoeba flamelloides]
MFKYISPIVAGFFGCLSSVMGKLGSSDFLVNTIWLRIPFFGLMFLSNALMFNFQAKAMTSFGSANATTIITGVNIFFSALFGRLLFQEQLTIYWFIGSIFITLGISVITYGESKESKLKKSEEETKKEKKTETKKETKTETGTEINKEKKKEKKKEKEKEKQNKTKNKGVTKEKEKEKENEKKKDK